VLAFMMLPTMTALGADALAAVPMTLREAALALGATPWQVLTRVVIPTARAGLLTGIVLGFARAMGEALAVSLLIGDVNSIPSAHAYGLRWLVAPFTTMTVAITDGVDKLAINPAGTAARYLLALLLLVVTFMCVFAIRLMQRRSEISA